MIRSILLFTMFSGLLSSQAKAQDATTSGAAATSPAKNGDLRKMYEDIEIMRRLLQGKLEKHYSARATGMGSMGMMEGMMGSTGMMSEGMAGEMSGYSGSADMLLSAGLGMVPAPAISIEGVYLLDHGIVFTVHFSESPSSGSRPYPAGDLNAQACLKCHVADKQQISEKFTDSIAQRPKPLTDWEKTRQDVLGIKAFDQGTSSTASMIEVCGPGTISELVWAVLGENGRHFSELPAAERVTVAITLGKPIKKQGSNPFGSGRGSAMSSGFGGPSGAGRGDMSEGPVGPATGAGVIDVFGESGGEYGSEADPNTVTGKGPGDGKSSYRDYLLLGDLHMQQNKPAQALKAYEGALSTLAGTEQPTAEMLKAVPPKTKLAIIDLHHKLTQAALASDQAEVAKAWVERLIVLQKDSPSKAAPTQAAKRLALPGRVIISAEKALLDLVGERITLQDFKTRAKVEHLSLKD